jgi:hypothetical protein
MFLRNSEAMSKILDMTMDPLTRRGILAPKKTTSVEMERRSRLSQ